MRFLVCISLLVVSVSNIEIAMPRSLNPGLCAVILGLSRPIYTGQTLLAISPTSSSFGAIYTVPTEAGVDRACWTGLVLERGTARPTSRPGLSDLEAFLLKRKYAEGIRIAW